MDDQKEAATGTFFCRECKEHQSTCYKIGREVYCPDCDDKILTLAFIEHPKQMLLFFL